MAPRRKTGIKDFYAQKKTTAPAKSKERTSATKRQIDTLPATYDDARPSTGTLGSDSVQPAALIAGGRRDYNGFAWLWMILISVLTGMCGINLFLSMCKRFGVRVPVHFRFLVKWHAYLVLLLDDVDDIEEVLRQFDMNMKYGPCIGVSRLERWERASKLGLDPPQQVKVILEGARGIPDCLWEGRV